MSLPTVTTPKYTIQLTSIKEPVTFRPYTVKEEKIFLMAKEGDNIADLNAAVVSVLENCTFNKIDIKKLPSFDVELLFLQLRAKSVNNVVDIQYRCENIVSKDGETKPCHALTGIKIPLDDITVTVPENHTSVITLNDELTLEMKYPTSVVVAQILSNVTDRLTVSTTIVASCIKTIVESNGTVHEAQDFTQAELVDFVESLTLQQAEQVQQFFTTMPSLSYTTTFTCQACGYTEPIRFEGLADFFD